MVTENFFAAASWHSWLLPAKSSSSWRESLFGADGLRSYLAAFSFALLIAAILTPLVRRWALGIGAVSNPGGRHVNARIVPRLGGIAILTAFVGALSLLMMMRTGAAQAMLVDSRASLAILSGSVVMGLLGFFDDLKGVRARYKLLIQIGVAASAYFLGLRIEQIYIPGLGISHMGIFALPITIIWIVGITNAINLIDGLDGLAAGVGFLVAATNFIIAYQHGSVVVALLMVTLMGSIIGFLFYNFNPARIFMGDSGSYFLGFALASSSLAGAAHKTSTTVALLVPMVALGLPIFDTLFSMFRRFLERRSIFDADRGHIHHRLLDIGLSHRQAVLVLYGVTVLLTGLALVIELGKSWEAGLALVVCVLVIFALFRFAGYFEYISERRRRRSKMYDPLAERLRFALPDCLIGLNAAKREEEALVHLNQLAAQVGGCAIHWGGRALDEYRWSSSQNDGSGREFAEESFLVGSERGAQSQLTVAIQCDGGELSREACILLQLLADSFAKTLVTWKHELAPQQMHSEGAA